MDYYFSIQVCIASDEDDIWNMVRYTGMLTGKESVFGGFHNSLLAEMLDKFHTFMFNGILQNSICGKTQFDSIRRLHESFRQNSIRFNEIDW